MKIVRKIKKNYDFYIEIKFLEGALPPYSIKIIYRKNLVANFADLKIQIFLATKINFLFWYINTIQLK